MAYIEDRRKWPFENSIFSTWPRDLYGRIAVWGRSKESICVMNVIANSTAFVMWGALIILNLPAVRPLTWGLGQVNVRDVVREKDPNSAKAAIAASPEAKATGTAREATGLPLDATSYSRVAGFVGTIVMASFLWALSNIIVYKGIRSGWH